MWFEFQVIDGCNQFGMQAKAFAPITVAFAQNLKDFQFANDVLDPNAFLTYARGLVEGGKSGSTGDLQVLKSIEQVGVVHSYFIHRVIFVVCQH